MTSNSADLGARRARTLKYGTNVVVGTILLLVVLGAVNWFAQRSQARLDLTRNKKFTISAATNDVLTKLKDRVTITVYATRKDTPPDWTDKRNQLEALLREYRKRSGNKVQFTFKDPQPDSKDEEEAQAAGVKPQQMQQASATEFNLKVGYLGFVVGYQGKTEKVPHIKPESSLEYQLTRVINKVAQLDVPKVGIVAPSAGNPMMGEQSQYAGLQAVLEGEGFEVRSLTADNLRDLSDLRLLMVFEPKELSEESLYHIDQFVMKGGKLMVAAAGVEINSRFGQADVQAKSPNVNSILEHYGLRIDSNVIEDWGNAEEQAGMMPTGQIVQYLNPFIQKVSDLSKDSLITKHLPMVYMVFPSSISKSSAGTSGTVQILAQSSEKTRVQDQFFVIDPLKIKKPSGTDFAGKKSLILSVSGKLNSRFAEVDPPTLSREDGTTYTVAKGQYLTESADSAQVVVCGCPLMFTNQALQQVLPNVVLSANLADGLTRGGNILMLRSKDISGSILKDGITDKQAVTTQVLILAVVPGILVVLGFAKMYLNRRRKAYYKELYAARAAA